MDTAEYKRQWYLANRDRISRERRHKYRETHPKATVPDGMKRCSVCGRLLPHGCFGRSAKSKDGLRCQCKECRSHNYQANAEAVKTKRREYYRDHPDRVLDAQCRYRAKNNDKIRAKDRAYYSRHADKVKNRVAAYYDANRERIAPRNAARSKAWFASERGRLLRRQYQQARRSRLLAAPTTLTVADWEAALVYFDYACCYCGARVPLTQDHLEPLSRGGPYVRHNIVPACPNCNSSKHAQALVEWFARQPFFSELRLRRIRAWQRVSESTGRTPDLVAEGGAENRDI